MEHVGEPGRHLLGSLQRFSLLEGSLAFRPEHHPVRLVERPAGLADAAGAMIWRVDLHDHRQMVAPQVRSQAPRCPPREAGAAGGQVGGGLASAAVADVGGFPGVQRGPAHAVQPRRHSLSDRVLRAAVEVPLG